ncbi:MAG: DUF1501 domain-containing protein [Gemmataceae bacterium]|nr:DUF1501 domain-containing protein [Gemmataceae bacterium]MCI0738509.1 DUF1501 domain-containing protein [Gemmataceae bacterium]
MLLIGRGKQRTCQGTTRREFIQVGASSVLGLSLADLLRLRASGTYEAGSARSVIFLWLWGGPAQLDTWDPKPNATLEYRGPFNTIPTRTAGVRIGELFPQIAEIQDKFAILRSLHTQSNDHGVAGTIGLTGSMAGSVNLGGGMSPGLVRPTTGAVVARARGFRGNLPPFIVIGGKLHQGKKAIVGEGGGPLGALYDPFRLEYDPEVGTRIPALQLPANLTPERLADRQSLLQSLAQAQRTADQATNLRSIDDYRAQALALLTSADALRMFDVARERPELADRYGRTRFGQSCLLARRLVEHGVPFVQVNWSDHVEAEEDSGDGGWDHHYRNFQIMQDRHAPWLDQAYSALISDLHQRGLLATTLVVAVGEFGRSPRINDKAGREHWEHCYSALVAGGGIRGGRVIGQSDRNAERPIERALTPADLAATIQHAIGITSEQAATLNVRVSGRVIEELF